MSTTTTTTPTSTPTTAPPPSRLRQVFVRLQTRLEDERAAWRGRIEAQLADGFRFRQACPAHHDRQRGLDVEASVEASYVAGVLTHVMERCPECAAEQATAALARRLGVPACLARATLDNFRCRADPSGAPDPRAESLRIARAYLDDAADRPPFLFFCGTPGTGKSHLAAALLLRLAPSGAGRWRDHAGMVAEVQDGYGKARSERILAGLSTCPVLVLDDAGGARGSPDAREISSRVCKARHEAGLPTIVTSNFLLTRLLDTVFDSRLRSRVAERFAASPWMAWDDYRRNPHPHGQAQ